MPDIALRTTFIVGYPGETEEEFQGLLDFVQAIEFDKVGAFPFSPEPGTPVAALPDQVAEDVKEERYARLMELQQPICLRKNQAHGGAAAGCVGGGRRRDGGAAARRCSWDAATAMRRRWTAWC